MVFVVYSSFNSFIFFSKKYHNLLFRIATAPDESGNGGFRAKNFRFD